MQLWGEMLLLLIFIFVLIWHFLGYFWLCTKRYEVKWQYCLTFSCVFTKACSLHSLHCVVRDFFDPHSTQQFSVNFLRPNNKCWHQSWDRIFTFLRSVWKCLLVFCYVILNYFYVWSYILITEISNSTKYVLRRREARNVPWFTVKCRE
jgi:hypothetical protein